MKRHWERTRNHSLLIEQKGKETTLGACTMYLAHMNQKKKNLLGNYSTSPIRLSLCRGAEVKFCRDNAIAKMFTCLN